MNNNIASILTTAYEIEGLLLVVSRHGNDTPSLVYERIQQAAAKLNEQCKTLTPAPKVNNEPAPTVVAAPAEPEVEEPEVEETTVEEPAVEQAPVPEATIAESPQQVPVEDREPDEDIEFEFIYDDKDEEEDDMEQSQQDDEDMPHSPFSFSNEIEQKVLEDDKDSTFSVVYAQPEPMTPEAPSEIKTTIATPQGDTEEATILIEAYKPAQKKDESIRVDEQLQRNISKDLRSAFSINDRFRFRRELFENDNDVMNNTLDLIESMESAQEAKEYFLNELGWDPNSEEVIDFLNIVCMHFA